jgi:hypothetical protein
MGLDFETCSAACKRDLVEVGDRATVQGREGTGLPIVDSLQQRLTCTPARLPACLPACLQVGWPCALAVSRYLGPSPVFGNNVISTYDPAELYDNMEQVFKLCDLREQATGATSFAAPKSCLPAGAGANGSSASGGSYPTIENLAYNLEPCTGASASACLPACKPLMQQVRAGACLPACLAASPPASQPVYMLPHVLVAGGWRLRCICAQPCHPLLPCLRVTLLCSTPALVWLRLCR